jgi:hypothetical protein
MKRFICDVVYDHKDGLAFVFDVFTPEKQNLFIPREAKGHGWHTDSIDHEAFGRWFDKYLLNK